VTTAFVLPGGSSLGAVQVGMAEALVEAGITPQLLLGTSAGSLNAAWLAGHPDLDGVARLRELWLSVRRRHIFPLSPWQLALGLAGRRDHLVRVDALERWLAVRVPFYRIEQANVPLHIMATDLVTGEAVRLAQGDVVDALMASTAIPGVFPPVRIGRRLLVDGGISADTPIGTAVSLGADTVYVLPTVGVAPDAPRRPGAVGVALQAMAHVLGHQTETEVLAHAGRCRVYVLPVPPTSTLSPFSFAHTEPLMDQARALARAWLPTARPEPADRPARGA